MFEIVRARQAPAWNGEPSLNLRYAAFLLPAFLAYYAGARLSLNLVFSSQSFSMIWIPNAILVAAFFLLPVRWRWLAALALFPAHYFSQVQTGSGIDLVLHSYLYNTVLAFLTVAVTQKIAKGKPVFGDLRFTTIYILAAAALVPLLASAFWVGTMKMADPAVEYGTSLRDLYLSNALAFLTIVPALVTLFSEELYVLKEVLAKMRLEAGIFAICLVTAIVLVHGLKGVRPDGFAISAFISFPLLLWASLRLGPAAASITVSIITLSSILSLKNGLDISPGYASSHSVLNIQLCLIVFSVSSLLISARSDERRRSEEDSEQKEKYYRTLIDETQDVIAILSDSGEILYENPAAEAMFGFPPSERIGTNCFEYIHPGDRDPTAEIFEKLLKPDSIPQRLEYRYRHKDGSWLWVEVVGHRLQIDNGETIVIANKRNITGRRTAEEALRQSEQFSNKILESSSDCIKVLDLEGNLVYLNPGGRNLLEIDDISACLGTTWVEFWGEMDKKEAETALGRAKEGKIGHFQGFCPTAKGVSKWWDVLITPITGSAGEVERMLVVSRDITPAKEAEEALRASEERYRNVVETQTELVCRFLPDSTLTFVNEAYCRFFERTREQLIGTKFLDLIPESDREMAETFIRSMLDDPRVELIEHEVVKGNGEIGWQQWVDHVIYDSEGKIELQGIGRDISERKWAERQLQEREAFISAINTAVPALIALCDLSQGRVVFLNDYLSILLGYVPEEIYRMDARQVAGLIHPEDREAALALFNRKELRQDKTHVKELRFLHKSGQYRWVQTNSIVFERDAGGRAIQVLSIIEDITMRKLAQNRLKEQEQFFRTLIEDAHDVISVLDVNGIIVYESPSSKRIFGYSEKERKNANYFDKIFTDEAPTVVENFEIIKSQNSFGPFQYRYYHKDGPRLCVETVGRCSVDETSGNITIIFISRDVTDRIKMEESLRESEEHFRSVAETASDAIITVDEAGNIQNANSEAEQIFGYEKGRLIGRPITILIPESKRAEYASAMSKYFWKKPSKMAFRSLELPGLHQNGSELTVELSLSEFARGGRRFFTCIARDIGERKKAEEQQQQLAVRLLNLQDDERRRIARELHDETAQNLAALSINLSSLEKTIPADEKIGDIVDQSKSLIMRSLKEVRTLSYLLHPPMLDDAGLISALRWYVEGFSKRSGIRVSLKLDESIGRLSLEAETTLYRVVQESLTNINRHSDSKSARLELKGTNKTIVLRIIDRGRGMSFDEPWKPSDSLESLGVGIMGMRQRLRQLGGQLTVESNSLGTTITASLPGRKTK